MMHQMNAILNCCILEARPGCWCVM